MAVIGNLRQGDINELLRTLNVNGDAEDSQPAETEE